MSGPGLLSPIVDLIFPPRCPLCGEALAQHGGLCIACWSGLVIPGEPACAACQMPLTDALLGQVLCGACLGERPHHAGITAATQYNTISRQLVLKLKHGRRIALAAMMARMIAARLPQLEGDWLVVPVPLHRWRLWRRGYNQSALLAGHIARAIAQPLLVDGLVRTRATPSLGHLGAKRRRAVLAGAIGINPRRRQRLAGAQVLLIDDVLTSGATTDACVNVLRRAGAAQVRIACFARVFREAPGDGCAPFGDSEALPS